MRAPGAGPGKQTTRGDGGRSAPQLPSSHLSSRFFPPAERSRRRTVRESTPPGDPRPRGEGGGRSLALPGSARSGPRANPSGNSAPGPRSPARLRTPNPCGWKEGRTRRVLELTKPTRGPCHPCLACGTLEKSFHSWTFLFVTGDHFLESLRVFVAQVPRRPRILGWVTLVVSKEDKLRNEQIENS